MKSNIKYELTFDCHLYIPEPDDDNGVVKEADDIEVWLNIDGYDEVSYFRLFDLIAEEISNADKAIMIEWLEFYIDKLKND